MAVVTALFDDVRRVEQAIQALQRRGIPTDHIRVDDDNRGGLLVTVETAEEGASTVRDMLEQDRRPVTAQDGSESGVTPEGVEIDGDLESATAMGLAVAASSGLPGTGGDAEASLGTVLGGAVAEETAEENDER